MDTFLSTETLIIELLLVASLVAIVVRRLRVPYTVALVVVGLLITVQQPVPFELVPELILALFVPPLLFEAAFHINLRDVRRLLPHIFGLAVPGVIITTFIVGGLIFWTTRLSWPLALVFGALIAATDPVAVVALFRAIGIPHQLSVLVESESLMNDGTAIVLFNLMLAIAVTGEFSVLGSLVDFLRVAVGGAVIGALAGFAVAQLIARIDDYLIETTLTTVLAFGSYLLAERLHVSGVLAVVAAGLIVGNLGPRGMSPTTRLVLFNFWEYTAFLANSFVFLLIGLDVNLPALASNWQAVLWAIAAVLVGRVIVVYGLAWLIGRFSQTLPWGWRHVLNWGGLRGAVSLALVLSMPATLGPDRELLRVMAFGVVLFTLLGQATTMAPLARRLKLTGQSEARIGYELRHGRLAALRAAESHLGQLLREGIIARSVFDEITAAINRQMTTEAAALNELMRDHPDLHTQEMLTARRELLRAGRSAIARLQRDGIISENVSEALTREVDAGLAGEATDLLPAPE